MAVGGDNPAGLVQIAATLGEGNRDGAGERHVALVILQREARLRDCHQRGGASGAQRESGSAQIQLVGDARGEELGVGGEHGAEVADLVAGRVIVEEGLARADVLEEITVVAGAGVDADRRRTVERVVTGVVEGMPAAFEEQAMLRIEQLGFARHDAEEGGVELVDAGDDGAGGDVVVERQEASAVGDFEFVGGEAGDRFYPGFQIFPELADVTGAGESAGHPDDGDASGRVWLHVSHEAVRIRRRRMLSCCLRARASGDSRAVDSRTGVTVVARARNFASDAMVG